MLTIDVPDADVEAGSTDSEVAHIAHRALRAEISDIRQKEGADDVITGANTAKAKSVMDVPDRK